jgi:hypothetical protein
VGTFSIGSLPRRKLKLSANGSICAIGADSKGHQQQNKAEQQQQAEPVLLKKRKI